MSDIDTNTELNYDHSILESFEDLFNRRKRYSSCGDYLG